MASNKAKLQISKLNCTTIVKLYFFGNIFQITYRRNNVFDENELIIVYTIIIYSFKKHFRINFPYYY